MSGQIPAFIAIGSNIEPQRQIPLCLGLLRKIRDSSLASESSWYRTIPWGVADQPEFINLVVGIETRLSPRELLRETQAIEANLNRVRTLKYGPRTLDLDILLFGEQIVVGKDLTIPHPGLLIRDFMLVPLIEIAPDVVHPTRQLAVRSLEGEIRYRQIIERMARATM